MDLDFVWQLPKSYCESKISSRLSADAQIYLGCAHCGAEARIDVSLASGGSFDDARCSACHKNGMKTVRHLEKRIYGCRDCQDSFAVMSAPFMSDRCPTCGSNQLNLTSSVVDPPFPARFDELLVAKDNPWGVSAAEDCQYIVRSSQALNFLPDFPLYLLTDILFSERLRKYGGYTDKHDVCHLLNLEGNLYRDYFRRTGEISAGLRAIPIFEQCVRDEPDAVNRALMEHNVSMAIYSLLAHHDEDLVSTLSRRKNVRQAGIDAAQRALTAFERLAGGDTSGTQITGLSRDSVMAQCARIHHIIGDLLKVGNASETELRAALEHFNTALKMTSSDIRFTTGVRESRAVTIMRLKNRGDELAQQAIEDLEFVISQKEEGRAWSEKMTTFGNLARLYESRGNIAKAVRYAERSVAIALHEMDGAIDERILKQKASQYAMMFEQLAALYASNQQTQKSLAVFEAFRAGTVRVHTMSQAARREQNRRAAKHVVSTGFEQLFAGGTAPIRIKPLQLEPILPRIEPLREYVRSKNCALISLGVSHDVVTALVLTRKAVFSSGLHVRQWKIDTALISVLHRYLELEPSPLREQRIQRICQECWGAFLQPLDSLLREYGVTTVGLSASGLIGQLPFEACFPSGAKSPVGFFIFRRLASVSIWRSAGTKTAKTKSWSWATWMMISRIRLRKSHTSRICSRKGLPFWIRRIAQSGE